MSRAPDRGRRRVLVAAAVTCALAAGCGIPAQDEPAPIGPTIVGTPPVPVAPTEAAQGSGTIFLFRGARLVAVPRDTPSRPPSAAELLDALARGPSEAEARQGLRSAINPATTTRLTGIAGGVGVVDLTEQFTVVNGTEQVRAVAQLVFTVTATEDVSAARFTLAGRPTEMPGGDGALRSRPLTRDDFANLAPLSPRPRRSVSRTTVSG